jgi:hypothetical protein
MKSWLTVILAALLAIPIARPQHVSYTQAAQHHASGSSHGRAFNGTNQSLSSSTTINLTATTVLTISFWGWNTTNGAADALYLESGDPFFSSTSGFIVDPNSSTNSGKVDWNFNGNTAVATCSFPQPTAGVWHNFVLVWIASANPYVCKAYVDGSVQSPTTTNVAQASPGVSGFGNNTMYLMARGNTTLWNAGRMADLAIWQADESGSASSIFGGTLPSTIDAGNLVGYAHFCGTASPEPSVTGAWNWALTGTPTQAAGPTPIINCP